MFKNLAVKRKVFISFHQKDRDAGYVDQFINDFAGPYGVFTAKALGVSGNEDFINSNNPEYVMSQIRQNYLGDSSVTIVLVGSCTHSRRYVDWELKSSLRQGLTSTPNGVISILLPYMGTQGNLPPRFKDNWNPNETTCYGLYRSYPQSAQQLRLWIEEAFSRRSSAHYRAMIKNSSNMMKYNNQCLVHKITH